MDRPDIDDVGDDAVVADRKAYEPPTLTEHPGWGSVTGSIGSGIT